MNGKYNLGAGFLFLYDWLPMIDKLSGEEFKALFMALIARQKDGTPIPHLDGNLTQMFAQIIEPTIKRRLVGQTNAQKSVKRKDTSELTSGYALSHSRAKRSKAKESEAIYPPQNAEEDPRFARFWDTYPNKKGKEQARQIFQSLSVTDELLDKMLSAIEKQKRSPQWTQEKGRFIPFPETWLKRGQWEDEETVQDPEVSPEEHNSNVDPNNFDTDAFFYAALARAYGIDPATGMPREDAKWGVT